ncbi:hypothetical protein DVK85_11535 [Flavobacterium arcticum]|uniref:Adhesin domain-containing protein n=1 Tax=Flavobacterium arcticum TaxID=1784713 RepID=A0A345HE17_9FLAO|nr:hypothetical protein [Flavobacterium arcticum]AXG74827.1 hypothetical protein DVK85_11535 [Flavobacterium arcticum]KAF2509675.1 DUF4097 domain-containing protein [Flavobacterium arcticum]
MKTITLKVVLLLLIAPIAMIAGEHKGKYKKEKKISKTYSVNADAALFVNNKYGNIYVTTWNENKTAIDVVITVSGNRESNVDKRLNSIEVDLEATISAVKAETKIGRYSGSISMEINYTIKIPKNGSINLTNIYGGITLGKIYGKTMIKCQYGILDIEELNSTNNSINIQYCDNSKIGYVKEGSIKTQYSDIGIERGENIELKGEYSDIKIDNVTNLNYSSGYGNVMIGRSVNVIGKSKYSDFSIKKLEKLIDISVAYGDVVINIDKTVKNISIDASYSDAIIKYTPNYSFNFELLLEYGDVNGDKGGFKYTSKSDKNFKSHYIGQYGSDGGNNIYIKSIYGDIKWVKM